MYFVWWLFDIGLKSIFQYWVVRIWSTESIEQLREGRGEGYKKTCNNISLLYEFRAAEWALIPPLNFPFIHNELKIKTKDQDVR